MVSSLLCGVNKTYFPGRKSFLSLLASFFSFVCVILVFWCDSFQARKIVFLKYLVQ